MINHETSRSIMKRHDQLLSQKGVFSEVVGHTHVIPVILCEAKLSASNIIDPHDSLNIPMKHNVFGMRHANLVGKRVHIQTLIYNKQC